MAIATDKAAYANRERVLITVTVRDAGGAAVAGANVSVTILTPNGRQLGASGSTDAAGIFRTSYIVKLSREGAGTYRLWAESTKSGYDPGSGTASFTAN